MQLDHLVWASPSLDDAVAAFADMSGVQATAGGRHMGIGSRNALADLGDRVYLAIDGPDREQSLTDNYGAQLAALARPTLSRFAVQTGDLAAAQAVLARHGIASEVRPGGRTGTNGETYAWQTLAVADRSLGAGMPIIKTWLTPQHPSSEAPSGCQLVALTVAHDTPDTVRRLYEDLGLDLSVTTAARPGLTAEFVGARGRFTLTTA